MPIPAHLRTKPSFTDSGIQYFMLCDPVREERTASSTMLQMDCLVGFSESETWLQEVIGFTEWDGTSSILQRRLPLLAEYNQGLQLYLDSAQLVMVGGPVDAVNGVERFDAMQNNWPILETCRYRMTFLRPRWRVVADDDLLDFNNREQERYVTISVRTNPRERRVPLYQFETNLNFDGLDPGKGVVPLPEVGFVPDYQLEIMATWHQVPVSAYPRAGVNERLATVNGLAFDIGGETYAVGELLFKGPQNALEWYAGVDGNLYYDVTYTFAYQPGGWNNQLLAKRNGNVKRYAPVTSRNVVPVQSPYASSDFQILFKPGS